MKQHLSIKVAALLFGGFALNSASAGDLFKPGLWEETTIKDGITNNPKGHVDYKCWTSAQIASLGSRESLWNAMSSKMDKSCTLKSYILNGGTLSYEIACKAGSGISAKVVAKSPTSKLVAATMNFGQGPGSSESSDRWVSADCGEHGDSDIPADEGE